jgi:hypothetical protein
MQPQHWTESRVVELLQRAKDNSQSDGFLGASLGTLLRRLDSTFYPGVLGDPNLATLLLRFPEIGNVERKSGGGDFYFRYVDGGTLSSASTSARVYLDRQLWLALTDPPANQVSYIDLSNNRIIAAASAADPNDEQNSAVSEEPERFLSVPAIPQVEIKQAARTFAAELEDRDHSERLLAAIETDPWYQTFFNVASELGRSNSWRQTHRAFVVSWAIDWLQRHDIEPRAFLRNNLGTPARNRGDSRSQTERAVSILPQGENLRKVVFKAVARMSYEELLNLSIPLRYLVP